MRVLNGQLCKSCSLLSFSQKQYNKVKYGIIVFDDCVPQVDIMAKDSEGGFLGTIGQSCDLENV